MQLSRTDTRPNVGDSIDGRTSLRLVKIRLALTLIAVALLPLAALAPLARIALNDPRPAQQERLTDQAEHIRVEIRHELDGIRAGLESVATSNAMAVALGTRPSNKQLTAAATLLAAAIDTPSSIIKAAAVVDASGDIRARAGLRTVTFTGSPVGNPAESFVRPVPGIDGNLTNLEVVAVIPGPTQSGQIGTASAGTVVASIPIEDLLRWANADLPSSAEQLKLVDVSGEFGAAIANLSGGPIAPGSTLEIKTNPSVVASGTATIDIPGIRGWQIVASAPQSVLELPMAVIAALIGLLALLVVFTFWMARKIIAPAVEMEEQRARFHDLYMTAREAALQDSLTGLGNHRAFQETLARMVEQARRYNTSFSLVMLDVDEFKLVNDSRGHATGDELLIEVGDLIRGATRGADVGFRIGGDEFAILLAETDVDGALIVAQRILSRGLEDRAHGRYRAPISFSAGITECPRGGSERLELTAQADAALYRGKREGRTVVNIFDPELDSGHVDGSMRSELSASISSVIESHGLSAVYQPIVHLDTGRILGYEGLVRVDPSSGFPHTGALFDAAEIAGRVLDLDRAALDVVLRNAGGIPDDALLSLNVSPRSFEAPEFSAATFLGILNRHGVKPNRVIMELTEREAVQDADRIRTAIQNVQAAGVRVAADDVGAGNAGLRLLSQFRFDVVKIDLSLVQGGAKADQTMSVLTSLVELAGRWGALTIAEGVETAAQLRMIRKLDVDAGQGYLLGRPGPLIETTMIDLEALAGAVPVGESPAGVAWPAPVGRPSARPSISALRDPVVAGARSGQAPAEPLSAHAIIANGAPSSFGSV